MSSLLLRTLRHGSRSTATHDILHRDLLLERLQRTIARGRGNNPLILGEPGVGKSALLHGLAFRLSQAGKQAFYKGKVIELDTVALAMLLAEGNAHQLDVERDALLKLAPAFFVLDDARLLFTQSSLGSLLYFLQPLLENPQTPVALVCSMAEYRRYIEREPVFSRELEPLEVLELGIEESRDILLNLIPSREHDLGIKIPSAVAQECVVLAKRYLQHRSLPDKAVQLLDDTLALAARSHIKQLTGSLCKQIVAERTGIPVSTLSAAEQEQLLQLENKLNKQVIGQPHVTKAVAQVIRRSRAGLKEAGRPIASFLFLGSSGVGKTELAKVLSKTIFHNERSLVRFDMSEFSEAHTVQRLVGAPPGYIGFEEGGQLTNAVLAQPYSLILLDELEKAHPKVFDLFLQVMDDGRLTDGKGRTVDFSNTIIIATSNLGLDRILAGFSKGEDVTKGVWHEEHLLPLLARYFRLEFLNRFDATLTFSPFSEESIWQIAQLELKKLQKRLEHLEVEISVDDTRFRADIKALYNPSFGARPIRRYLQETIENTLADQLLRR
jgi:ATP-dependent Clp protease ATP-binding subunit ClpC